VGSRALSVCAQRAARTRCMRGNVGGSAQVLRPCAHAGAAPVRQCVCARAAHACGRRVAARAREHARVHASVCGCVCVRVCVCAAGWRLQFVNCKGFVGASEGGGGGYAVNGEEWGGGQTLCLLPVQEGRVRGETEPSLIQAARLHGLLLRRVRAGCFTVGARQAGSDPALYLMAVRLPRSGRQGGKL
jgi:hypothetical protein